MATQKNIKVKKGEAQAKKIKKTAGQLSVDIFHSTDTITLIAPIAGANIKDINITVQKDVLTISGKRTAPYKVAEENYYTKECFWGDFSRSIVLPLEANTQKIAAKFENGILEIAIPKNPEKTQVIKIKSA